LAYINLNLELHFECWDYNSENVERETDLLATSTLNIKQINYDKNMSAFHWINLYDSQQQIVGEALFEFILATNGSKTSE
jgi:hypothetical protein